MSGVNFNDTDQLADRRETVQVISSLEHLPAPDSGVITLLNGYFYVDGIIDIGSNQLKLPDDADITFNGGDNNVSIFRYSGGGSMFIDDPATVMASELRIQFMQIELTAGGTAFDFPVSVNRRNTFWLKGTFVSGADQIGIIENCDFFSLTDYPILSGFLDGFALKDIGQTTVITQGKFADPSAAGTFIDFKAGTFTSVSMSNSLFDPPAGLSVVNFSPGATFEDLVLITGNSYDPVNGGNFWKPGVTGSITAFADAGAGQVTVTSTGHGLNMGDSVQIEGTTNYNGGFVIANVLTNTFEITDTWVSDDATGTFDSGSLMQDTPEFVVKGNSYIRDSSAFTFCEFSGSALTTTISTVDTPVKVNAVWSLGDSERFLSVADGRATYIGLEDIEVDINVLLTAEPSSGGALLSTVYIYKNGSPAPLAQGDAEIKAGVQMAAFGLVALSKDDFVEVFIENNTNGNNIDVLSGSIKVT